MAPVKLCPHPGLVYPYLWETDTSIPTKTEPFETARSFLQQNITRRETILRNLGINSVLDIRRDSLWNALDLHQTHDGSSSGLPLGLPRSVFSHLTSRVTSPSALVPLNECILAIAWEFHDRPPASTILDRPIEHLVRLLQSSAIYQAKLESVSVNPFFIQKIDYFVKSHSLSPSPTVERRYSELHAFRMSCICINPDAYCLSSPIPSITIRFKLL